MKPPSNELSLILDEIEERNVMAGRSMLADAKQVVFKVVNGDNPALVKALREAINCIEKGEVSLIDARKARLTAILNQGREDKN